MKNTTKKKAVKGKRKLTSKKPVKNPAVKKTIRKVVKKAVRSTVKKPIGVVTHFFGHLSVGIVKFSQPVRVGTTVRFLGATTDFTQPIVSMQYEHQVIAVAKKGQQVGIKVKKKVHEGNKVYLVKS